MKLTPKEYLLKRLDSLKKQCDEDDWDGYNAYPLELISIVNTEAIIKLTPDDVLSKFNLFPSPNGTLSFDLKDMLIGGMSIGNTNFSYVAHKDGKDAINGKYDMNYHLASQKLIDIIEYFK